MLMYTCLIYLWSAECLLCRDQSCTYIKGMKNVPRILCNLCFFTFKCSSRIFTKPKPDASWNRIDWLNKNASSAFLRLSTIWGDVVQSSRRSVTKLHGTSKIRKNTRTKSIPFYNDLKKLHWNVYRTGEMARQSTLGRYEQRRSVAIILHINC